MPKTSAAIRSPAVARPDAVPMPAEPADIVDRDLLDRVFDRVCSLSGTVTAALLKNPELAQLAKFEPEVLELVVQYVIATLDAERPQLRAEFGGADGYIAKASPVERAQLERDILTLFNGRNASEVARRLNVGRATVYRVIKQGGR